MTSTLIYGHAMKGRVFIRGAEGVENRSLGFGDPSETFPRVHQSVCRVVVLWDVPKYFVFEDFLRVLPQKVDSNFMLDIGSTTYLSLVLPFLNR